MTEEKLTKQWKTIATFSNFEEADKKRHELKNKHETVKVKRAGKGGKVYKVKVWDPPAKENKKSKKRHLKNDNKKVRSR